MTAALVVLSTVASVAALTVVVAFVVAVARWVEDFAQTRNVAPGRAVTNSLSYWDGS